jgi:ABC-type Fe3+-hydroxamate transport system substrate-binding protein
MTLAPACDPLSDPLLDAIGTRHSLATGDVRIVSLVPSITELLCSLGLADRLVGRTGFCVHPAPIVRSIPKVGGTKDVDLAKVRALRPTHVIVNIDENERPMADALQAFVPHIVVTHPCAPEDNIPLYRLLGALFDRNAAADRLVRDLSAAMRECRHAAQSFVQENVLYLIWRDPWMTVAADTYISRTLALVGWRTLPDSTEVRYPTIELDAATLARVDRILLSSEPYRFTDRHIKELARHPAVGKRPVSLIDGEMTSWYGNRAIAGMQYLPEFRRGLGR